MNANLERRWIESEARYDDARRPKRVGAASSQADNASCAVANDDVRNQEGNLTAAVEEAVASNRGNGPVNGAATEHLKDDLLDDSDDDDNDDASGWTDLFSDPDPMDEFHFRFELPVGRASDGDDISAAQDESNRSIDIHLVGYKAELGQTLHSTGLTLWRASSLLCDFLLQHPGHVRGKSVVEVRDPRLGRGTLAASAQFMLCRGSAHTGVRSLSSAWRRTGTVRHPCQPPAGFESGAHGR
jgi:hypothetical protein